MPMIWKMRQTMSFLMHCSAQLSFALFLIGSCDWYLKNSDPQGNTDQDVNVVFNPVDQRIVAPLKKKTIVCFIDVCCGGLSLDSAPTGIAKSVSLTVKRGVEISSVSASGICPFPSL